MVKVDGQLHLILRTEDDDDSDFDIVLQADLVGKVMHGLDITIQGQTRHFGPHVLDGADLIRDLVHALQELAVSVGDETATYVSSIELNPEIPFA